MFGISKSQPLFKSFSQYTKDLKLEATLQDLQSEMDNSQIEVSLRGEDLYQMFEQNPLLCGVILREQNKFVGMISRHHFWEMISRQYGRDTFLTRTLECLHSFNEYETLMLPANTLISEASEQCIQRYSHLLYEPLLVKFDDETFRLLDVQKLLLAQAQSYKLCMETVNERNIALAQAYQEITEKNDQMLRYLQQAKKVTTAAAALENNKFEPESLNEVAARGDQLGQLARVFRRMVQTVKTREQELADAKEKLEAVLNAVPGLISWIDSKGLYVGVNRHLAENWNISQEDFIGQDVGFLSGHVQLANFMHQFLASSAEAASQVIGIEVQESVRYYLVAAQKYQQGKATVLVGIDITERKKAEEALQIAEENYRGIFENALEGIFQAYPNGQYSRVNPAMAKIYGYASPEEMIASVKEIGTQIYVDPSTSDQFNERMEQQQVVKGFKYQVYRQDGSIIWVEENTRAVQDTSGNLLYEGIVEDITLRKQKEADLKRQLQELQIEIDQQKLKKEVAEITQSDYFQDLQAEADNLRFDDDWWSQETTSGSVKSQNA